MSRGASHTVLSRLAILALTAGAWLCPCVIAGASATPPAVAEPTAATVRLDALTPGVPGPEDELSFSGTVTNDSDGELTLLNAYLRLSTIPLRDADDLARFDEPGFRPGIRTQYFAPAAASLLPGASADFQLDVDVVDLGLTETGVYVLGVEIRATSTDGSRGVVGSAMTVLPYVPDPSAIGSVGVAWVWPLTAQVARDDDGTFRNDDLGAAMELTGQLGAAFAAAGDAPVTWLVDPAVAQAAADMAEGYSVLGSGGNSTETQPGTHAVAAAAWLEDLRSAAALGDVALLPYGDVDSVALMRAGLSADLASALGVRDDVDDALVPGATTDVGFAPGGFLDGLTLDAFGESGVRHLLVATTGLDTPTDPHAPLATVRDGVRTYDAVRLETPTTSELPATPVQQRQLLLAQTALAAITSSGTGSSESPTLVLTPPAGELSPTLVGSWLDIASSAPWVRTVALDDATGGSPVEGSLIYPPEARAAELPADYLAQITALRSRQAVLASLTNTPDDDTSALDRSSATTSPSASASPTGGSASPTPNGTEDPAVAGELSILRAESASWRGDLTDARTAVSARIAALDAAMDSVHIASVGTVTLSSNRGRFPLTVQNELDEPVTVRIDLRPRTPGRLRMSDVPNVSIGAGQLATVNVEAEAGANGTFEVDVQLFAPNGAAVGAPTTLVLKATDYDTVAWIVVIAAGGLLFAASGVRITRRILRARRG